MASNKPTYLKPKIKTANLSALIRHRINADREYPATIHIDADGVVAAYLKPPIQRLIQQEHADLDIGSKISLPGETIAPGAWVLIQYRSKKWQITSVLDEESYNKQLHREVSKRLMAESIALTTDLFRDGSRRRLETLFSLPETSDTPWAVPGRIKNGQTLLSRRIMSYFSKSGGATIDQALRKGMPKIEDWGSGPILFGVYPSEDPDVFSSVAIPAEEHRLLVDSWDALLKLPSSPGNSSEHLVESGDEVEEKQVLSESGRLKRSDFAVITEAPSTFQPLPLKLSAIISALKLPMPAQPLTESMSTLVAWTEADHPALSERSTDFFLTLLADGSPVRPNANIPKLWTEWHRTSNPIAQLCTMVASGEEPAAIRSLVGRTAPGHDVGSALADHLLLRWRRQILKKYEPDIEPEILTVDEEAPTIVDLRLAVRHRGLCVADVWLDRLFLALGTARDLSIPLILVGNVNTSICILETILKPALTGSRSTMVSLPKKRSQILGRISLGDDIFILSPFAKAIRKASRYRKEAPSGYWSPYFVVVKNPNRHIHSDVLHTILQQASGSDGVMLYTEEDNERWLQEYKDLQTQEITDFIQNERRELLELFFESTAIGNRIPEKANRLFASHNLSVVLCVDTKNKAQSYDALKHGLVLFTPDIDITELQETAKQRNETLKSNLLPDFNHDERGSWERYPKSRQQILDILRILSNCNLSLDAELAQHVSTFLGHAEQWGLPDDYFITSHVLHTMILPRIECRGDELIGPLRDVLALNYVSPDLQKTISTLINRCLQFKHQTISGAIR
ncbi:MAG: hypothetical protein ACON4U_21300 [Myxococcota bacterium]